jgi:hypothetical protein
MPLNGRFWYILLSFGILSPLGVINGLLVHSVASLVYIFPFLVCCANKNLATLRPFFHRSEWGDFSNAFRSETFLTVLLSDYKEGKRPFCKRAEFITRKLM